MEAELISAMCQRYRALPAPGSVIDQPIWVLRMHVILQAAESDLAPAPVELADLQEMFG
jgi:hypothetical protein